MSNLDTAKDRIDETTEAIRVSAVKMVETAREANKTMNDVSGKMRDGSEKLAVAIDKMMKIAGRGDFAETVRLTESLVSSLERLADLEQRGLLDKVMRAMGKGS